MISLSSLQPLLVFTTGITAANQVATQIPHDTELAPIPYMTENSSLAGDKISATFSSMC